MDQTKIEVITGVLEKQVGRNRDLAVLARREMSEHMGAAQVLALLAKQMPSLADQMEKRIDGDADLGGAAAKVRVYVRGVIAQFSSMCEAQSNHQRTQAMLSEGRAQAAEQSITVLEKEITLEQAVSARRAELDAERRAKEEADKAPPAADEAPRKRMPRKRKAG